MATDKAQEPGGKGLFTKANLKAFLLVNLGVLLLTVGVYFFKLPNNFTTGGVSGLAILLSSVIPFLSTATLMGIINVLLLVLGYLFLGKEFGFWTTYCSLMYSLETWVLERVYPMDAPFTNQPLLELCFAMMLPAVGSALMFNYNASSGGTDTVAMILKKYTSISDIGKALFVSDSVIALAACFFFGIETGMFSLLGLFLKAFVVDSVIESINLCKFFSIVTSKPDEICDFIIKDLHHSSTGWTARAPSPTRTARWCSPPCAVGKLSACARSARRLTPIPLCSSPTPAKSSARASAPIEYPRAASAALFLFLEKKFFLWYPCRKRECPPALPERGEAHGKSLQGGVPGHFSTARHPPGRRPAAGMAGEHGLLHRPCQHEIPLRLRVRPGDAQLECLQGAAGKVL